jgi:short-subunit dehydrogenase
LYYLQRSLWASGGVLDLDFSTLQYQFNVNVFGTIELLRRLIPLLKLSSVVKVIFISSILGLVTSPYLGAYCASKHALESLITALRMESYGQPIYFSSVRPGLIKTNFLSTAETMFDKTIAKSAGVDLQSYESFRHIVELNKQKDRGLPPAAVVKTIDRVVNAKRPKRAYYVTFEAHFMGRLQRFLPSFVYVNYII